MKVGQFLKVMMIVTFMAVLYIHLQMKIFALAYQGKSREQKIEKLAENNVIVRNDILRLKSSDHIGRELLAKEKSYKFVSRQHVVEAEERDSAWTNVLAANNTGNSAGGFMTIALSPVQGGLGK